MHAQQNCTDNGVEQRRALKGSLAHCPRNSKAIYSIQITSEDAFYCGDKRDLAGGRRDGKERRGGSADVMGMESIDPQTNRK